MLCTVERNRRTTGDDVKKPLHCTGKTQGMADGVIARGRGSPSPSPLPPIAISIPVHRSPDRPCFYSTQSEKTQFRAAINLRAQMQGRLARLHCQRWIVQLMRRRRRCAAISVAGWWMGADRGHLRSMSTARLQVQKKKKKSSSLHALFTIICRFCRPRLRTVNLMQII